MTPHENEIKDAAATLGRSDRGRQAMRDALALLNNGGVFLDSSNQAALATLFVAAWSGKAGTAQDAMREALAS